MYLFEELFIGVVLLYLITYGTIISFNVKYLHPLFNKSFLNLVLLVLLLGCFLSFRGDNPLVLLQSTTFSEALLIDALSYDVKCLISIFAVLSLVLIQDYTAFTKINSFEYYVLILCSILGLLLLCTCNDFLTMFLALELQSLSFYVLASIKKRSSYSVESGLKYFVIGSVASGLFLFGVSLIYGILGTVNLLEIHELTLSTFFSTKEEFSNGVFLFLKHDSFFSATLDVFIHNRIIAYAHIGFFFIFVSFFIKISIAPFHLWSPDVYENSPTSSSLFFVIMPKLSIFLVWVKLCYYSSFGSLIWLKDWVFILILLSIFVGGVGGFEQRKLKSLFSYSSISHSAYLLMSLVFESFESLFALIAYLIIYASSGISLWGFLLLLRLKNPIGKKQNKDLSELSLLVKSNPLICLVFVGSLFSLAGLPPLFGFLVKLNILLVAVANHYFIVALLSLLFSVISLSYYLRLIKVLVFEPVLVGQLYEPICSKVVIIPNFIFLMNIFLFFSPSFLYNVVYKTTFLFFFT